MKKDQAAPTNHAFEYLQRQRRAFAEAKRLHPEPYVEEGDDQPRRTWRLVDADAASGNPALRGTLVLQEQRGEREHPFIHWLYTAAAGEVAHEAAAS
jgi:hypothetical protein